MGRAETAGQRRRTEKTQGGRSPEPGARSPVGAAREGMASPPGPAPGGAAPAPPSSPRMRQVGAQCGPCPRPGGDAGRGGRGGGPRHTHRTQTHAPMRSGRAAATRAHALHTLAHRHAHARRVRRTPGCHDSGCRAALGGRGVQPRTAPRGLRRACWMRSTRRGQGALSRGDTQVSTFRQRRTQPPWRPRTAVPAPTPWGAGSPALQGLPLEPCVLFAG